MRLFSAILENFGEEKITRAQFSSGIFFVEMFSKGGGKKPSRKWMLVRANSRQNISYGFSEDAGKLGKTSTPGSRKIAIDANALYREQKLIKFLGKVVC